MQKTAHSLEEFEQEAAQFVRGLTPRSGATLVTLSGILGAGKTAFTKAAARALGVRHLLTSPTFILEKIYPLPARHGEEDFARLVHIDAYRLTRGADLSALQFADLMRDPGNLIFLEWPEQVSDTLPTPAAKISFELMPDGVRRIIYA